MLSENTKRGLLLVLCSASTLMWCGCRSGAGLNMFARKSEPSADVLAGTGPSTTYLQPPSASATPQAIASVAGGTAEPPSIGSPTSSPQSQIAGINISPGDVASTSISPGTPMGTNSPQTNFAAAQANGVYGKPTGSFGLPPSSSTPSTTPTNPRSSLAASPINSGAKPSPYTFGSKTFSPKNAPETPPAVPASSYGTPSGYGTSSYAPATSGAFASKPSPSNSVSATAASMQKPTGGFTLPTGVSPASVATAAPSTPSSSSTTAADAISAPAPSSSYAMPRTSSGSATQASGSSPASFSTANASGGYPTSGVVTASSSSYAPGSTGSTSSYPGASGVSNEAPATSGSIFR